HGWPVLAVITDDVAGPHSGQDCEFERPGCNALLFAQLRPEGWQVGVGQRDMVLDLTDLAAGGQQLIKVSLPPRRVLTLAQLLNRGPWKDGFDPAAHPTGGFRLDRPDRLQDFHDQRSVDLGDR